MIHNEGLYLEDFILFYISLGVDHIYLSNDEYYNSLDDGTHEILRHYGDLGFVTHTYDNDDWGNDDEGLQCELDKGNVNDCRRVLVQRVRDKHGPNAWIIMV